MKKTLKLMIAVLMIFSLTACFNKESTDKQEEVVESFFKYVSKCQFDKLHDIAKSSIVDDFGFERMEAQIMRYSDLELYGKTWAEETKKYKETIFKNLFLDMEVVSVEVDGDTTLVEVSGQYTNYDTVALDGSAKIEALQNAYISENSQELNRVYKEEGNRAYTIKIYDNITKEYYKQMNEILSQAKVEDMTAIFQLEKKDDKWIITNIL